MTFVRAEPPGDWTNEFERKKLHVVCVAASGFTACSCCASIIGNMKYEEVLAFTTKLNWTGETGTFWPRYPLTVVPSPHWENRTADNDLQGFYRKCFIDVAEVHRRYVKLPNMVVDLNGYSVDYDYELARKSAEGILLEEDSIETICFLQQSK